MNADQQQRCKPISFLGTFSSAEESKDALVHNPLFVRLQDSYQGQVTFAEVILCQSFFSRSLRALHQTHLVHNDAR